jgi:hypothetical protein
MKFISALFLAGLFLFPPSARAQDPKEVGYNAGTCGGSFTVQHVVLSADKKHLTLSHYMPGPGEVVKDPDPLVFDYKEAAEENDSAHLGVMRFEATTKYKEAETRLFGFTYKGRFVATMIVDNNLVGVFYGAEGTVEDMTKVADKYYSTCKVLHEGTEDDLPQFLISFLFQDAKSNAGDK